MSEAEKSQKTEEPTRKRLKKAREQGKISTSKDLVTIILMISVFIYFYIKGPVVWDTFKSITSESTKLIGQPFEESVITLYNTLHAQFISIIGPLLVIIIIMTILAHIVQFGFVFSFETIVPKLSKISPISGFKKIFSFKNFLEFIKSVLKMTIITIVVYFVFLDQINSLIRIPTCKLDCAVPLLAATMQQTINISIPIIFFLALLDMVFQKKIFLKSQRMTKEELKRERKDDTGDPHIVSQRKSLHKEIVSEGIQQIVENASLIIFDYGEQAVILQYDPEEMPLPLIAMITRGAMTEKLAELAREFETPTMRDGTLVAELINYGRQGQYIPSECVEGVANALKNAS